MAFRLVLPPDLCYAGQEPGDHRQVSGSLLAFGGVPNSTGYRGPGKKCEISHPSRMENFRMLENMGTADG